MQMTSSEVVVTTAAPEVNGSQMTELAEFQLAFVGGGVGEVVLS